MKVRRIHAAELFDAGWKAIEDDDCEEALRIGRHLKRLRYSGAFEILALAHCSKGNLARATKILEEGVRRAPTVWRLWHLLGNYRSDGELYAAAFAAYRTALACPHADKASVHLNWAIALNRAGQPTLTIKHLKLVRRRSTRLRAGCEKTAALIALRKYSRAARMARGLVGLKPQDKVEVVALASLYANLAECIWRMGKDLKLAQKHAWRAIALDRTQGQARWLIREVRNLRTPKSGYWRIIVRGKWPWQLDGTQRKLGFMCPFDVVADSPEEALKFATQFEPEEIRRRLSLEEFKKIDARPNEPKEVYWVGARFFYPIKRRPLLKSQVN